MALLALIVFIFAARALWAQFGSLRPASVVVAGHQWGRRFPLALALCAMSFLVVGLIERRALHWAKTRVPIGAAFRVSFIANGLAHSLGATALVAGAVRARLYARYGVDLTTAATVTAFQTVTSTIGFAALAGLVTLAGQGLGGAASPLVGGLMLAAVGGYLLACGLARGSLKAFGRSFELPEIKEAMGQVGLGMADNALAMAVLWVLLPERAAAYFRLVADYAVAYVGGALSGVPGGLGPFESVLAALLPRMEKGGLVAAFLGFRLVFYILPLMVAGLLFLGDIVLERRSPRLFAAGPLPAEQATPATPARSIAATNAD